MFKVYKSNIFAQQTKWQLLIIYIFAVATYIPTFFNDFTNWDDLYQVTNNPDITSLSLHNIKVIFSKFYVGMYQPLATLGFAVIYKFFELKAIAYHSFSLMLHLINIFLVYSLIKKITNLKEIIFGVAILFALNPLQVEAVAWISATSTLIFSLFYLLSLIFYFDFIKNKRSNKKYYYSLIIFLLALLSKSAAVTLPLILLLFDYFINSNISKKDILNKIPFFALSIAFGILTIIGRKEAGHIFEITKYYNFFDRILFIFYSIGFYFYNIFLPFKMSAFHPYPNKTGGLLPFVFYLIPIFLILITVFLIKTKRNKKEILFGIIFFLLSISVMIELIPVGTQIVKERYIYLPCIGIYFAFFTFIFSVSDRNKKYFFIGIILISLVFSALSFIRTKTWNDSYSLWNDVINKYPKCSAAFINRGNANVVDGNYDNAINDLNKAILLEPTAADAYMNRAIAKSKSNDMFGAIKDYDKAISIGPIDDKMYAERAVLKSGIQDISGATEDITSAIKLNPSKEKYYNQRGIYYGMTASFENAKSDFSKAIELNNDYADAWSNRGFAKLNLADFDGAISDITIAINKNPSEARSFYMRGMAYAQANKKNEACSDFQKAYNLGMTEASAEIEKTCK